MSFKNGILKRVNGLKIDLAYELDSRLGSELKDHGGDPENKYAYLGGLDNFRPAFYS